MDDPNTVTQSRDVSQALSSAPAVQSIVRSYNVIRNPTGKSFSVWWSDATLEGGSLCWRDGGYVSTHRTVEAAQAQAEMMAGAA